MLTAALIREFSNIGHHGRGRNFAGFKQAGTPQRRFLEPRAAIRLNVAEGELVHIGLNDPQDRVALIAFSHKGQRCEASFGLPKPTTLPLTSFDNAELIAWLSNQGAAPEGPLTATIVTHAQEPVVMRVPHACILWLIAPSDSEALISARAAGTLEVLHQAAPGTSFLPEPLGDIREEFTVSRATAQAFEVRRGEVLQIIDVEGQQCSDFQAFRAAGLETGQELMIDSTATRSMVRRAFPGPGLFDKFCDPQMAPMLRVLQDTCGRHDTFGLACTARGYEERGFPGHVNCSDNISAALSPYGVTRRNAWPAINFFWNTWIDEHHHLLTEESHSRPGDYVAMEALDDLVCVSTACPDDIDPINGWNPTDVHVRIYRPETRVIRAVAYRSKEDAPMQISRNSAFHDRLAPLTDQFVPARDLWTPVSFPSCGTLGEYWACREAATLQDMSGLRKYDVIGPDAERLLQKAMTRDITRLAVWRASYALMCDESGEVIDDGTLFRLAPDLFRWCCGSEESGRWLTQLAEREGLQVRIHDMQGALPNLALQGPKSREILSKIVFTQPHVPTLDQVKWFGVTVGRLNDRDGVPFLLTRTGYTGELGYELFCSKQHALEVWDSVMAAGEAFGLEPMGSAALETIRIEAGLVASGAEFAPGVDAFEAGLGFAVDLKKSDFVGRDALMRNTQAPRRKLCGVVLDADDVPRHGAPVFAGERQVGVVTSATRSPMLERAIAMARLSVEHTEIGTALEIGQLDGRMKRLTGRICDVPFIDPKRERARA